MLDTNVIYNISGGELLRGEVGGLINASASHADLVITWYLPEVVRNEREHQLRELARKTMPAIHKLERVLDFEFNLTDQVIIDRIRERIDRQIHELKLEIIKVNPSSVDWSRLMSNAAFREPPFSPGENEKGFRDAVIVEAVSQLVASCTGSRIVVVTGDELLIAAIGKRTSVTQNVHLLSSIEELKGLINTLVSNVDESFIQQMRVAATGLFFEQGNRETFFYKGQIKEKILRQFTPLILTIPEGANEVQRGKTLVSHPRFKEKVDDRMYWISRIAFRVKAYADSWSTIAAPITIPVTTSDYVYSPFASYSLVDDDPSDDVEGVVPQVISNPIRYSVSRTPAKIGHVAFDVTWSITVTPQRRLTAPQIESIDYVETSWE